jgi:hypothetical protein
MIPPKTFWNPGKFLAVAPFIAGIIVPLKARDTAESLVSESEGTLFTLLPPEQTGVRFANTITEDSRNNQFV